jgi:hypothetical protein
MAVVMRVVTKKPADVDWWYVVEPEKAKQFKELIDNFEGLESITTSKLDGDENCLETVLTFDNSDSLGRYFVVMHQSPVVLSRNAYNTLNGITMTFSYTEQA